MSIYGALTTEYNDVPLWGWILIIVAIIGIIFGIKAMMDKKKADTAKKDAPDEEAANVKLPEGEPPKTPSPSQQFPRDAPLPPPAPSETSNKA